jgi:hypothetical protein
MKKRLRKIINLIQKHKIVTLVSIVFLSVILFLFGRSFSENVITTTWDGTIAESFTTGNGTKSNPYIIKNGSEFALMLQKINSDDYLSYFNKYYVISNNINFDNKELPLTSAGKTFKGHIKGNGFTLSNIVISKSYVDANGNTKYNLFDSFDSATINYLNIDYLNIQISDIAGEEENHNIYASIFGNGVANSNISNLSLNNVTITDNSSDDVVKTSIMFISDADNNTLNNINLNVISNNANTNQIFNTYSHSALDNIFYTNNDLMLLGTKNNLEVDKAYHYEITEDGIVFDEEKSVEDVLKNINENSEIEWMVVDNQLRIKSLTATNRGMLKGLRAGANTYYGDLDIEDQGLSNNTLYIDDLDADLNYYKSLNYTEVINGSTLPGVSSTNYYNENTLVAVQITYDAADYSDSSIVGHVSPTENANKYVYYKYYPLERDHYGNLLTDSNNHHYIKVELIDNPFSARPTGKGFNGWGTKQDNVKIIYDSETYTRYAIVPITESGAVLLNFNAIWAPANILNNTTNLNSLPDKEMINPTRVIQVPEIEVYYEDCDPRYFNRNVTILKFPYASSHRRNEYIRGYYTNNNNNPGTGTTIYYTSGRNCNYNTCYVFDVDQLPSGTNYDQNLYNNGYYRILYAYGNNYRYTTSVNDYLSYSQCRRERTIMVDHTVSRFEVGESTVGYFYYVGNNYNTTSQLFYDRYGTRCDITGNSCSSGAYKLIQHNDNTLNSQGESIAVTMSDGAYDIVDSNRYFYLVTRDLNIVNMGNTNQNLSSYMVNVPLTVTGSYNGAAIATGRLNANTGNFSIGDDMVIENVNIYGVGGNTVTESAVITNSLSANAHNLKIGRNVKYVNNNNVASDSNKIFSGISGLNATSTQGSASNPKRFKVIVESGSYNYLVSANASATGNNQTVRNQYLNSYYIYGNDYDRVVTDNNDNLKVYFNALSSLIDNLISSSENKHIPGSTIIIKSGNYGKDANDNYSSSNTNGIYAGGRTTSHSANALRVLIVEGGDINVINGGPCVETNLTSNSVAIYMKGGKVRQIYGGAGTTTTYGNRIVSVTGGDVSSSIFGGSNAYDSGDEGLLTGSTLVYVGGTAEIGDETAVNNNTKLFNVSSGNVFGAGNGEDGGTSAGIVSNSHIIINGGTIRGSVYGGGNHGSVGTNNSQNNPSNVVIDIYDGDIQNSVFGAGESFGGGTRNNEAPSGVLTDDYYIGYTEVYTDYIERTVTTTNWWGETVSGPTTTTSTQTGYVPAGVYMPDGSTNGSRIACSSSVIGSDVADPVSQTSTASSGWFNTETTVTVTTRTTCYYATGIAHSGETYNGNQNYYEIANNKFVRVTPSMITESNGTNSYNHTVTINLHGGEITNQIYGGSNVAGTLYGNVNINLYKGEADGVYGGGKGVSGTDSAVSVLGNTTIVSQADPDTDLEIGDLYGGSALGSVNFNGVTTVTLNGGTFANVYGGGKGDNNTSPHTLGNITVTLNDGTVTNLYGGNNLSGIPSGNVEVYLKGGTVGSAFGGGSSSSVNNTNIYLEPNGVAGNVYGGSNMSGTVQESKVYLRGGTANYVYGGNNIAGTTLVSNVYGQSGTINNAIYGGGNEATTDEANVTLTGVTSPYAFGGGNKASVTTTNVSITNGTITNLYGGGNEGTVTTTNLDIAGGNVTTAFGGGNKAEVTTTNVEITNGTVTDLYGGGNEGYATTTNLDILGGNVTTAYGGGNKAGAGTTNVLKDSSNLQHLYGGSNQSGTVNVTNVHYASGYIQDVFGGNNAGGTATTTNVIINNTYHTTGNGGALQIGTAYGGNNIAGTAGTTNVTVVNGNVNYVYGGGYQATTQNANVTINGGTINTSFGGGNEAQCTTTTTSITGGQVGTVYGGGNNAQVSTTTAVTQTGGTVTGDLFGGGNNGNVGTNTSVTLTSGRVNGNVFGGCNNAVVNGNTNVYLNGTNVGIEAYGGGNNGSVTGTTNISQSAGTITGSLFGGGKGQGATVGTATNVTVTGGTTTLDIFGGGNNGKVNGATTINFGGSTVRNIYGGGNNAEVGTNTHVVMNSGTVTQKVFGGGNNGKVTGSTLVELKNGTIQKDLYGGGNYAEVTSNTVVKQTGGIVTENLYGGGNQGIVQGTSTVTINNGNVLGSAYAAGNLAAVNGNATINIGGTTTIGSSSCTVLNQCGVFGGGNNAVTGQPTAKAQTHVNIAGGTIYGNVYGGANTSVVNGSTSVMIGNGTSSATVSPGAIHIGGTVFGGGESNASGSPDYDYSAISVTDGINIVLDGLNYNNLVIDGSIFGSGNASSSQGDSYVTIKNYGSRLSPKDILSIQRTTYLNIINSSIKLFGAKDKTNKFDEELFSLCIIKNLYLKDNTTLYLKSGFNLVESLNSQTASGALAQVNIDTDNKTITRNVNNRIYTLENMQLNIAKDENNTIYGEVNGMTFYGLFNETGTGGVVLGLYDDLDFDDQVSYNAIFTKGSYVQGLHKENHNIEVDGFYTNVEDEESGLASIMYIDPANKNDPFYRWIVGEVMLEYSIDLVASKYSTLGATELPFDMNSASNTSFRILGFDYSGLESGVSLVDKANIPRVAPTSAIADNTMALVLESGKTGWLTNGSTNFLSNDDQFTGTTVYVGENSNQVPTMLFYLMHSRNLETEGDMGTVTIVIQAETKVSEIRIITQRLVVTVHLSRRIYLDEDYEAAISPGRKYSMFASTATNIESKSILSAYYSLFIPNRNIYRTGYNRALVSEFVFPVNTKITMIDLSTNEPTYYYHIITPTDVTNAQTQFNQNGLVEYKLSMFEVMGALNSGVHYDDAAMNLVYYDATQNISSEEFIFIIDFKESGGTGQLLNKHLTFELLTGVSIDGQNEVAYKVLANQYDRMQFSLYELSSSGIDITGESDKSTVYSGQEFVLDLQTSYSQEQINYTTIYNTRFFDSKMGIKLSLLDANNNVVSGTSLLGLHYIIDGETYYPNIDGTTRIKVSEKVGNIETWVRVVMGSANVTTGNYKMRVEVFGSPDGIYYGLDSSDYVDIPLYIINEIYGLDVDTTPNEMIIDSATGNTLNNSNLVKYNIEYNSGLTDPKLHIKLYRRSYEEVYDTDFEIVDLTDYVTNLFSQVDENEYLVVNNPRENTELNLFFKSNLQTGTYKVEFILYDGTTAIGSVDKYIIIK